MCLSWIPSWPGTWRGDFNPIGGEGTEALIRSIAFFFFLLKCVPKKTLFQSFLRVYIKIKSGFRIFNHGSKKQPIGGISWVPLGRSPITKFWLVCKLPNPIPCHKLATNHVISLLTFLPPSMDQIKMGTCIYYYISHFPFYLCACHVNKLFFFTSWQLLRLKSLLIRKTWFV